MKSKRDFDKELQQLIKAHEKESKAFSKKIHKFSRKNRTLANSLSDQKLAETMKVQSSLWASQVKRWANLLTLPIRPEGITRSKARLLISSHFGYDYDQVEKLPVSKYREFLEHAIEVEKSRNQPIEELKKIKKIVDGLNTDLKELVSKHRELSAEGQDRQKEKEKLESQVKGLNIELSVRNTKILQQRKQLKKKSGVRYRFEKDELASMIDDTRKKNGKHNYTKIAEVYSCHRDTVKRNIELLGLTDY